MIVGAITSAQLFAVIAVYALVMAFVAGLVWESKGGTFGAGAAWGFLLGIFGLFYVGFARPGGGGIDRRPVPGDMVTLTRTVTVSGDKLYPGERWRLEVIDLVDGEPMAKITDGSGGSWWVSGYALKVIDRTSATKSCPDCAEDVKAEARICRFCGHTFAAAAVEDEQS